MATDEIARGEEAKRILESQVFKDAMGKLEEKVVQQLKACPIAGETASNMQQQKIMLLQVSDQFKKIIKEMIDTGKLASVKVLEDEKQKRGIYR